VKKLRRCAVTTESGSLILPREDDAGPEAPAATPDDELRDRSEGERPAEKARRIVTGPLSQDH